MPSITIRNISDELYQALKVRAVMHGRSVTAEIRCILENTVRPDGRIKLGSLLTEIGREVGGVDLHVERDLMTNPCDFS
jgi:plasmid stability protein